MSVSTHQVREDFDRIALLTERAGCERSFYHDYLLRHLMLQCESALEIGCGTGAFTRQLAGRAQHVTGIDLSPQMLRLAGRMSDGTIVFLGGVRYVKDIAVPVITAAAQEAGRPAPRIIAGAPVLVTDRPASEVREEIAPKLASYEQRPVYRAVLDMNGSKRAADVVLIGRESEVRAQLDAYAEAGATDFLGGVQADQPDEAARTQEVLARYANR